MNIDADGLIAVPTLDASFMIDSRGRVISTQDCCIVCQVHAPRHCTGCHL
jgi:hypothetical protein